MIRCCPACDSTAVKPLFFAGYQPMSLVALKADADESAGLIRRPVDIMICTQCSHCFNREFDPDVANDYGNGCHMWNDGFEWRRHVEDVSDYISCTSRGTDCIIDVGAGDCSFLDDIDAGCVKMAIDPASDVKRGQELGIKVINDYFDPYLHVPKEGTVLLIMRHLLEHMESPHEFMCKITDACGRRSKPLYITVEVPCIENALEDTRVEDWTYEHPQHFTFESLNTLMANCGYECYTCDYSYGEEVLVWHGQLNSTPQGEDVTQCLERYQQLNDKLAATIKRLDTMNNLVYWGGAGKSSLFIGLLGVSDDAIVVDSDENKFGMYVPGTGIKIQDPEILNDGVVRNIVVTTAWRADDIAKEVRRRFILWHTIWKLENGELVEV